MVAPSAVDYAEVRYHGLYRDAPYNPTGWSGNNTCVHVTYMIMEHALSTPLAHGDPKHIKSGTGILTYEPAFYIEKSMRFTINTHLIILGAHLATLKGNGTVSLMLYTTSAIAFYTLAPYHTLPINLLCYRALPTRIMTPPIRFLSHQFRYIIIIHTQP